ncbi:hypothetical protein MMYC01_202384 [Madurella mycetomatis]|uniref:Peptidyl-tRNA hydrolase n=1 Tax=Madurella mycetomatis TaxID=100816 RepID=A0A175W8Y0_9PEZI|nr:hypothetical protein MMYC01_202384 [Madurella mycetomatis]
MLALPLLAAAAESPFEQYKAKFQNFLSSFGGSAPVADKAGAPATPSTGTAKGKKVVEAKPIHTLTLDSWKDTLYAPVKAEATQPEEWMVLISGRNKSCYGHCLKVEKAFNESATRFAVLPQSPHLGYINCDDEPVLCNSWMVATGNLYFFEMLPAPAPVDIYYKRLNLTTTTAQDIVDAYTGKAEDAKFRKYESYFHPFDGVVAKYGLSVPIGYVLWGLNAIPSWGMMLVVSFISRSMMNRRMGGMDRPGNAPGPAPRGAPPGDGRS